jgi:hypothetical protein
VTHARARRIATTGLVILGCVLAFFAAIAMWLRALVLDTDAYVRAVGPVLENSQVRQELAEQIVDQLYSHVDVAAELRQALPKAADAFASTIAAGIRNTAVQLAADALGTAPVQRAWREANRLAHAQIVRVLEGKGEAVSTANGEVAIETAQLAAQVRRALDDHGITVFDSVPPGALERRFVLFKSHDLTRAQQATRVLDDIGTWLPVVSVLALAGAVVCSLDRRRTCAHIALGVGAAMVAITIGVAVGRAYYLHAVGNVASRAVAAAPFDALATPLRAGVRVVFVVALVGWLLLWFAGSKALRAREAEARTAIADVAGRHARPLAVTGVILAAMLLVAWDRPRPIVVGGIVGVLLIWESLLLASTRTRVPPATPAA